VALLVPAMLTAVRTTETTVFFLKLTFMKGMFVGAKPYSNQNWCGGNPHALNSCTRLMVLTDHAADRSRRKPTCGYAALQ
jgi:hypothetical protein